jgi:hypothetical protein
MINIQIVEMNCAVLGQLFLEHVFWVLFGPVRLNLRPLQNTPFCPIPASGSNFNPQNTQCIHAVKILAFLGLEQN